MTLLNLRNKINPILQLEKKYLVEIELYFEELIK